VSGTSYCHVSGTGGPGFARTGRRLCPSAGTPATRRRSTSYEGRGRGRAFRYMMGLAGGFIRVACVPVLSGCGGLGGPGELECDVAGAPAESARRTMGHSSGVEHLAKWWGSQVDSSGPAGPLACQCFDSGCGGLGGPGELECDVAGAPAESARRTMRTFKRRGRNGFVAALRVVGIAAAGF
jgi:hypothetical protein